MVVVVGEAVVVAELGALSAVTGDQEKVPVPTGVAFSVTLPPLQIVAAAGLTFKTAAGFTVITCVVVPVHPLLEPVTV